METKLYIENRDKCFNLMAPYLSASLAFSDRCKDDLFLCFELMYKTGMSDKYDDMKRQFDEWKSSGDKK